MSNEKYSAAAAGLTLAAIDGAQMMIESLRKDREYLSNALAAARLEIASLQGRVNECGAGAGCCAQAARIADLEAQHAPVVGGTLSFVRAVLAKWGTPAPASQPAAQAAPAPRNHPMACRGRAGQPQP